jgi:hypothetical protein
MDRSTNLARPDIFDGGRAIARLPILNGGQIDANAPAE